MVAMPDNSQIMRFTDQTARAVLKDEPGPFLLLFESRSDPSMLKMLHVLETTIQQYRSELTGGICMVEDCGELCRRLRVEGVPTMVCIFRNSVVGRIVGVRTEKELARRVEQWSRKMNHHLSGFHPIGPSMEPNGPFGDPDSCGPLHRLRE